MYPHCCGRVAFEPVNPAIAFVLGDCSVDGEIRTAAIQVLTVAVLYWSDLYLRRCVDALDGDLSLAFRGEMETIKRRREG